LKRKDKIEVSDEMPAKQGMSVSDKIKAKLDASKADKLKGAKRLSELIGTGHSSASPDIDLQPSDDELYVEGSDSHAKQDEDTLSGKTVKFITQLVASMFAKMQKASQSEILDTTLAEIKTHKVPKPTSSHHKLREGGWSPWKTVNFLLDITLSMSGWTENIVLQTKMRMTVRMIKMRKVWKTWKTSIRNEDISGNLNH